MVNSICSSSDHFSYLLCSPGIHSSFPAASAAPPGGEAAPPTDGLLAAPACVAAIFSTAQAYNVIFVCISDAAKTLIQRVRQRFKWFQQDTGIYLATPVTEVQNL